MTSTHTTDTAAQREAGWYEAAVTGGMAYWDGTRWLIPGVGGEIGSRYLGLAASASNVSYAVVGRRLTMPDERPEPDARGENATTPPAPQAEASDLERAQTLFGNCDLAAGKLCDWRKERNGALCIACGADLHPIKVLFCERIAAELAVARREAWSQGYDDAVKALRERGDANWPTTKIGTGAADYLASHKPVPRED